MSFVGRNPSGFDILNLGEDGGFEADPPYGTTPFDVARQVIHHALSPHEQLFRAAYGHGVGG